MNILSSPEFQELDFARKLPSSTGVARHIAQFARRQNVAADDVTRVVKADPVLAARLIEAANAVSVGRRPIVAIPDAVELVGVKTARAITLDFSLPASTEGAPATQFDHDDFCARSLASAVAFSAIAHHVSLLPAEEAFIVGLLARIGTLALATIYPREYDAVLVEARHRREVPVALLERQAFAADHNTVAAAFLTRWGMPKPLVDAVATFENDELLPSGASTRLARIVRGLRCACHAGDTVAQRNIVEWPADATALGLTREALASIAEETAAEWALWQPMLPVRGGDLHRSEALEGIAVDNGKTGARLKIVLAEDDAAIRDYLRNSLAAAGHEVLAVENGRQALELALAERPQVIVTDWVMPEMDGVSLCRALRETAVGRGIYVVVMTDAKDPQRVVDAFDAGADDYAQKPITPKVLAARLRAAERVLTMHREFEQQRDTMLKRGVELARTNRRYEESMETDPVTGFPGRRGAATRLEHEWAAMRRRTLSCVVLRLADDAPSDTVVNAIARILRATARTNDVYRLGRCEFLVLCPGAGTQGAAACAERLREAASAAATALERRSNTAVQIGVSGWDQSMRGWDALVQAARAAATPDPTGVTIAVLPQS